MFLLIYRLPSSSYLPAPPWTPLAGPHDDPPRLPDRRHPLAAQVHRHGRQGQGARGHRCVPSDRPRSSRPGSRPPCAVMQLPKHSLTPSLPRTLHSGSVHPPTAAGVMTRDAFLRKIVPVGLLFSASLVLSNWVYLRLSVSFSESGFGLGLAARGPPVLRAPQRAAAVRVSSDEVRRN